MRLKEAINRFATQLQADGKSPNTKAAYLRELELFKRWLGMKTEIAKINPATLAEFFAVESDQRSTVSTNRLKTTIRVFFRFLSESGYIKADPSRLIKSAPTQRKTPGVLDNSEIARLLKTIKDSKSVTARRDFVIVSLLYGTGMRLGSLVALNATDIDAEGGTASIHVKGGREERVYLKPDLVKILSRYIKGAGYVSPAPLIQSTGGRRLSARQIQYRISYWMKEAGIDHQASVHTLRHTFATRLYEKTGDLHLVQRALCHRQITTTEIYARVSDGSLKAAMKLI